MDPWYKVVSLRKEVREGRSFNPDEFAIHLEQVVAGTAPEDYRDAGKFFARTCFTRALTEHVGMVLRRVNGETANTAPVLTLVTQFGGGKTHTLATLYHLATKGPAASALSGVGGLLQHAALKAVPHARVAVFAGNAWDPQSGRETPWIDVARQLAGDPGVALLGSTAATAPPGTEALGRVFAAAGEPVLVLFDEVLNFVNRHRGMAEPFHAFIQNLTVAMTGQTHGAAVISLPRSQTEMTDWDLQWQEKITKVVRRVAKDLIVNDEGEIAEVIRRRLFDEFTPEQERHRRRVAKTYAAWCFQRRAQLPPEWSAVDSVATEERAHEHLQSRFEACYPFHPATLSVFQRKWQALPQYQQTRGTLAMLAQWVSWAYRDAFQSARREALITLGSAPLEVGDFRSVVLGQVGETRLGPAIEADIAGTQSHARSLDLDAASGPLKDIHRRVATTIFFESSGGQKDLVAHLPELRFALGEPEIDTTSVDTAALALESKAFFIRRVGADGFRISHKATLKKVVNDRRASLDDENEVAPAIRALVKEEFERGKTLPVVVFPADGSEVADTPKLTLVVAPPASEWTGDAAQREQLAAWLKRRGKSDRLYPGALVWCLRKPGRELHARVVDLLAWRRVKKDLSDGVLGDDFEKGDKDELAAKLSTASEEARDEVWASYRFVVLADPRADDGLKVIDLGAGHASAGETLSGRVVAALRTESLLNEGVGAGYLQRNWPPALKESGAWPLTGLRQAFLTGALTRLLDPDAVLRRKIPEFVARREVGLASGRQSDGSYARVWFDEPVPPDEIAFEPDVFLLTPQRAVELRMPAPQDPAQIGGTLQPPVSPGSSVPPGPEPPSGPPPTPSPTQRVTLRLSGEVPLEAWNRVGTKLIPKLRNAGDATGSVHLQVTINAAQAAHLQRELQQALDDLGISASVVVESS